MLQSLSLAGPQQFGYKLGQGLRVIGRGRLALIELLDNKGRFGLGMNLLMKNSFKLLEERKGSVPLRDVFSPYQDHFSSSDRGHYARTFQGIGRRGAWSGLHYSTLSQRVLHENNHIFRRWYDFCNLTRDTRQDVRPLDHWALLCGCIGWVKSIPSLSD